MNPIGIILDAKVMLAPMAGVTDVPFRTLVRKFGCKFAYTEMIDVNGIVYKNKKSLKYLDKSSKDNPLGAQIVGYDEERMVYVAKLCEDKGFDLLDINAGCPARKVVKGGKGSALLKDTKQLKKIIKKVVKALTIPVTVKIRSGWDEEHMNYLEVAKVVEGEGASAIGIHPRTKVEMYKGKVNHNITKEIKAAVNIPVFASGNIYKPEDVVNVMDLSGCDAVYIARGVFGHPWIFQEINALLQGKEDKCKAKYESLDDMIPIIIEHYKLVQDFHGEFLAKKRMYKHLAWYLKHFKNINEIMVAYRDVQNFESFKDFLGQIKVDDRKRLKVK